MMSHLSGLDVTLIRNGSNTCHTCQESIVWHDLWQDSGVTGRVTTSGMDVTLIRNVSYTCHTCQESIVWHDSWSIVTRFRCDRESHNLESHPGESQLCLTVSCVTESQLLVWQPYAWHVSQITITVTVWYFLSRIKV